jgi:hypothetical protein
MDRIIIALTKLSRENWGIIYRFIKSIVQKKDIEYRQHKFREINTIAQLRINVGLSEVTAKDVYSLYGDVIEYEKVVLLGETTCFSIIYHKSDDSEDFTELVPFILLQQEFGDSIMLGIDIGELDIKKQQSYRFRCSDFFYLIEKPTPKLGKNSLYFINAKDLDKKTGEFRVFKVARFAGDGESGYIGNSSRRFLPLIKITENNYKTIFGTNEKGNSLELRFIKESIEKTKQDWKSNKSLKSKWSKLSSIFDSTNSLFEQWFQIGYFNSFGEELKDINLGEINGIRNTLQIYKDSIVELVQNIIFHGGKMGLLYCVFDKKFNITEEYQKVIPNFDIINDTVRFLRIGLFDHCDTGIIDTFGNYLRTKPYEDAINDSFSLSLRSFFDKDDIVTKGLTRLEMRYAAGLGIKTFVKTIVEHKGFFSVESNFHCSDGCKKTRLQTMLIDEKIMLGPEEESDFANGTHYRVVLPIVSIENNKVFPFQRDSILTNSSFNTANIRNTTFSWTVRNRIDIDFAFISNSTSKNIQIERIRKVGSNIIEEIKHSDGTVWNLEGKELDYNLFFKLVSFIQLNSKVKIGRLILVNATDRFIGRLYDVLNELIIDKGSNPVWSKDFAIIVYSLNLYSLIIWGETKEDLYYINQESQRFNYNYFFFQDKNDFSRIEWDSNILIGKIGNDTKDQARRIVLPYDVLIRTDKDNRLSLFEAFLNRLLKRNINPNNLGFLVCHDNTYIGNKIIVRNYYEADLMFQNNFFTDRFAYLIAHNIYNEIISKKLHNKKLLLIGYNHYSEVLIKSIEKSLQLNSQLKNASLITDIFLTIFFEGKDTFSNDSFFDFDIDIKHKGENTKIDIINNPTDFLFVTIVPIGATLSTNDKIISFFKQSYGKKNPLKDESFIYNHCVVVVRDSYLEGVSFQEKCQRWKNIDLSERIIRTGYTNAKAIHFTVQVAEAPSTEYDNSNWVRRLNNELSFPENWWKEKYVNYTENSSINSQNLMGFPRIAVSEMNEENHDVELNRIYDLKDDIYKGHIEVLNCHHKYYIDTERFVKRDNNNLNNWLAEVKKNKVFNNDNNNIIITPNVERESDFIFKIKDTIFNGNALVIYLDVNNWRNNMIHKLSYLKNFPKNNVKFHYVDQAFLSGETFHRSKSYLFSILEDTSIGFTSIITVINRLSYAKNLEIKNDVKDNIFSFVNLHYPGSKEGEYDCELCKLDGYYRKLAARTVLDSCNSSIIKNREKLFIVKKNEKDSKRCSKRGFIRLIITHEIYYRVAEIVQSFPAETYDFTKIYSEMEKELNGVFSQLAQNRLIPIQSWHPKSQINKKLNDWFTLKCITGQGDILDKLNAVFRSRLEFDKSISFLKVISSPPLSKYIAFRKYAHEKLLDELKVIISRADNLQNDFVYEDLKLIKSILKSLSFLKSNALVRKEVIIGVWRVLGKVICNLERERYSINSHLQIIDKHVTDLKNSISQRTRQPQENLFNSTYFSEEDLLNDIAKLNGLRKELISDLTKLNEEEIIQDFSQDVQFFIKNSIVEDDAKSTFLGELLRQGIEMRSFDNIVISKTLLSLNTIESNDNRNSSLRAHKGDVNDLFCYFNLDYSHRCNNIKNSFLNELKNKKRFQQEYNSFLVWLFYDNTTIIRKTLRNFEKDLAEDKTYHDLFFDDKGNLKEFKLFKEGIDSKKDTFIETVKKEYYYSSFVPYLSNGDGIDYIEKLLYVAYAEKKLLLLKKNKKNIETDTRALMEVFSNIMGAEKAFWIMKQDKKDSEGYFLYPISSYIPAKYYDDGVFSGEGKDNVWNTNYDPRELKEKYITNKVYSQKRMMKFPLFSVSDLRIKYGERKELDSHRAGFFIISGLNYLAENYPNKFSSNRLGDNTIVASITFLYDNRTKLRERDFRIRFQESGRLLLLLKNEINDYVLKYLINEKVFDIWERQFWASRKFDKIYANSSHVFKNVYNEMDEFEKLDSSVVEKLSNTWFFLANETISFFYSNIERNISEKEPDKHCLKQIEDESIIYVDKSDEKNKNKESHAGIIGLVFNKNYITILSSLLRTRWKESQDNKNHWNPNGEKNSIFINNSPLENFIQSEQSELLSKIDTRMNKHLLRTIIAQCINNSLCPENKKGGHRGDHEIKYVYITISESSIMIKDERRNHYFTVEERAEEARKFEKRKEYIKQMQCEEYSSTTLTTLQGVINYLCENKSVQYSCDYGFNDENNFYVIINF